MNEKLIELLGLKLPADAKPADTQAAILAAVKTLADNAAAAQATLDEEAKIRELITQSHGALTPDSARDVLKRRAEYAKAKPQPKKK
jgi:hypothetical protein